MSGRRNVASDTIFTTGVSVKDVWKYERCFKVQTPSSAPGVSLEAVWKEERHPGHVYSGHRALLVVTNTTHCIIADDDFYNITELASVVYDHRHEQIFLLIYSTSITSVK